MKEKLEQKVLQLQEEIARRKIVEDALAEEKAFTQSVLNTLQDVFFVFDLDGRFLRWNRAMNRVSGHSNEEISSMKWSDFFLREDLARTAEAFERVVREGHASVEATVMNKDGRQIPFQFVGGLPKDHKGNIIGISAVGREIIERKRSEEALKASEKKYRTLIENLPQKIFYKDKNSIYVSCNENYARDLKIGSDKITGKTDYDFFPKEFAEKYRTDDKRIMESGGTEDIEEKYIQDGREVFVYTIKIPVKDERDNIIGVLGIFWDITERKQAEEEIRKLNEQLEQKVEERTKQLFEAQEELVRKKKLAILGQLAGSVGHELRNPFGVINNAIYFLKTIMPDADETVKEYLNIINEEILTSERIVSDLLDFARTKTPQKSPVTVGELITQSLKKCKAPENVTVEADIPETLPEVIVDPRQMGQVFQNLITNALQAMPEGGELRVAARSTRDEGRETRDEGVLRLSDQSGRSSSVSREQGGLPSSIEISVTDTGEGIKPENMAMLFQPLYTTKARGIGLGLVVSKNLVEANGGRLETASHLGKGTTFTVILPVERETT